MTPGATRESESPPPSKFPYSLALFLASPKKKGEKEGRRSARGRFFQWNLHCVSPTGGTNGKTPHVW